MTKHKKEVIDFIEVIQATVKLLEYPIITEHSIPNLSKLFIFKKEKDHWVIIYRNDELITSINDKTKKVKDSQGIKLQKEVLREILGGL